jgi:signal transduction histidine kinase
LQILTQLIKNSLKFTQRGSIEIGVSSRHSKEENRTIFSYTVKDSGIGIAPEQQHRIFEPFTLIDDSATREQGGAGMGLAICSVLARFMGANIHVLSNPGEGSTFIVEIPVEPVTIA